MADQTVYFWRESDKTTGWLSQWYYCPFRDDEDPNRTYSTAEHYMMYQKAMLFGDSEVAAEILVAEHPRTVKDLGRKVRNFDEKKWVKARDAIVYKGNFLKFTSAVTEEGFRMGTSSKPEDIPLIEGSLKEMLIATGDKEIVEASPYDRIWGVGFTAKNADQNRKRWGLNLLGKALMQVREELSKA